MPTPPGPRGLPVLGNALEIPNEHTWLTFTRWAKKYGLSLLTFGFIAYSSRPTTRSYRAPLSAWEPNYSPKHP